MVESGARANKFGVADSLLLAAPAVWAGFRVVARNLVGIPHLERLVVVSLILWVLALVVVYIVVRLGAERRVAVYTTFIAFVLLVGGGGLFRAYGQVIAWTLVITSVTLMWVLASKFGNNLAADIAVFTVALALLAGPALDLVRSMVEFGESEISMSSTEPIELDSSRDVFLIVLDGFPGLESLAKDFGPGMAEELRTELSALGFQLPTAWAAYPATNFSIPSILAMDYPVDEPPVNRKTLQDLYDIVSGDNPLRESAAVSGFTTHMVESGWSGSSCRGWYQHCVASPWFDDPMYFVVWASLLGEHVLPGEAYQYAVGSKATMEWLESELPVLSSDSGPDFVFAHVVAPHPPLYLDSECEIVPSSRRGGFFFLESGVPFEERQAYLEGQIECVISLMKGLANQVEQTDALIFVSDHGSDRRGQPLRDPSTWSREDVTERMNAFVAARIPQTCHIGDEIYLPNVMRVVTSCQSREHLPLTDDRMFLFTKDWTR